MRTENKDKELNHRHFIGVRLTDVELNLLDQGAASFSISRSEYVRKLLLEKQIYHQVEVVADMNDLKKLVSEYGKIGSNLNQIARYFNTGGSRSLAVENEIHFLTFLNLLPKSGKQVFTKNKKGTLSCPYGINKMPYISRSLECVFPLFSCFLSASSF